mgnify:CR=1 FL=1
MNITINGNVTINLSNITINEARTLAEQGDLTLRQLRSVLPGTKGVKTPSRAWVREHMDGDEVLFTKDYESGDKLVVFMNGFYCYGDENWTVLRVDGFSRLYYETDEDGGFAHLDEEAFLDEYFIGALGTNAIWQLKRNAEKRDVDHGEISVDNETMEMNHDEGTPDILELLIDRDLKAENHDRLVKAMAGLTEAQREVIVLRYWRELTIPEIARQIGRKEESVKDRIKGAMKSLKKNF